MLQTQLPETLEDEPQQPHLKPTPLAENSDSGHFKCPQGIPYRAVKPSGEGAGNVMQDENGSGSSRSPQTPSTPNHALQLVGTSTTARILEADTSLASRGSSLGCLRADEMPSFNLSTSSDVVSQSFLIVAMNLASWGTDSRSGLNCF